MGVIPTVAACRSIGGTVITSNIHEGRDTGVPALGLFPHFSSVMAATW